MTQIDLLDQEIDLELRASLESLMAKFCSHSRLIALYDGDRSIADLLWDKVRLELGLAGILVPEERGGAGLSAREAAVVMETLGRYAAATPFLTSSIVATTLLLLAQSPLVSEIASGERTVALVVPFSTSPVDEIPAFDRDDAGRISGMACSVAGAIEADTLILPIRSGARLDLCVIPATEAVITPRVSLDMTRQVVDVSCEGIAATVIAEDAERILRRAILTGAILLASEQVGVARWCLDTSVAYLKERRQFGQPLGGFQALKHRLADLYVGVENAGAAARYAAVALSVGDPEVEVAAAVAQAFCSDIAVLAGEEAVQLHAGMGMTWEHPAHLYLKRAKADQIAFGNAGQFREWLASLVDLPFAAARPQQGIN